MSDSSKRLNGPATYLLIKRKAPRPHMNDFTY